MLKQAQSAAGSKQKLLNDLQKQLTDESACVQSLQTRSAALESQLRLAQEKNVSLQTMLQVRRCSAGPLF